MERQPNTQYVASISYGKDSLAMLEAIKILGYPLDRIVTVQVWATQEIPADLPEMYEFKQRADEIIFAMYGIRVEHIVARDKSGNKLSYDDIFYRSRQPRAGGGSIYGFAMRGGNWCTGELKTRPLRISRDHWCMVQQQIENGGNPKFSSSPRTAGAKSVQYIGIAVDEHKRIAKHENKPDVIMPLVKIGWAEEDCRSWCEANGLLSPVYQSGARDGCWFCHNQSVEQLRRLRKNYPELWAQLLKWDIDSPVSFHPDGRTVRDFDRRFEIEDKGYAVIKKEGWRWKYLDEIQTSLFDGEDK